MRLNHQLQKFRVWHQTLQGGSFQSGKRAFALGALLLILLDITVAPALAMTEIQKKWEFNERKGVEALDSNLYGLAEPFLKEAAQQAEMFGADDPRLAKSLGELGRLYTIRRRYTEAEYALEQELHYKEVALGRTSGKLIPAMGSLVRFYMTCGTLSKAEPLTDDIIAFVEGKIKEESAERKEAMGLKGGPLIGWAGSAAPSMHTPLVEWAVTCDDLGGLYLSKRKFDMAERLFKAALDIKATVMGKQHMSLANSYENLAGLALAKGETKDAESYYKEALQITTNILGIDDPKCYSSIEKLARCYIQEKKYSEAEALYKQIINAWRSEPNGAGSEARALYALGSLYCTEGKYGAAASTLGRALHLSQKASGPCSIVLVPYMQKYAYALYYCGQRGASEGLKARANYIAGDFKFASETSVAKAPTKTIQAGGETKSTAKAAETAVLEKDPKVTDKDGNSVNSTKIADAKEAVTSETLVVKKTAGTTPGAKKKFVDSKAKSAAPSKR